MDKPSELLLRSVLHDLANVLAGIQGVLELNPPGAPLSQRDRERCEAVLAEGNAVLERARHLAMGTLPERALEPGQDWRDQLRLELAPLGALFRCRLELVPEAAPELDQWPGPLLRGYARAVTRLVLPYARGGVLTLRLGAEPSEWVLRWGPPAPAPEDLRQGLEDRPGDTCGRWAERVGSALGAVLGACEGALEARIPRR